MKYIYTPEEAISIADTLVKFLKSKQFTVKADEALNAEAPCITTLIAIKGGLSILFEAQDEVSCDESLKDLALWMQANRYYAELFIATHIGAKFTGTFLKQLDQTGIGLILIDEMSHVKIERHPNNAALRVSAEPSLKFRTYESAINTCLEKFNQPVSFLSGADTRKDALRDVCELVESLTEEIAVAAIKKGFIQRDESQIRNANWSNQINILAARNAYATGVSPFVSDELKTDLHSFRNGRNLVDHKVRSKREEAQRQQKFPDRIITGIRLVADLAFIKSKIARKKKLTP